MRVRRDDGGSLVMLEITLAAAILLLVVAALHTGPADRRISRGFSAGEAEVLAGDVLEILAARPGGPGYGSYLHELVTEAIRGKPGNLTHYLDRTLPAGAGYGLYLNNGEADETIVEKGSPTGEVASESILFYPDWNYALAFATLDRHPGTTTTDTLHVKVVPVRHSYLDRTSAATMRFENGRSFAMTRNAQGLLALNVAPEHPTAPNGYDVPYATSSLLAHTSSVTAAGAAPAVSYGATVDLPWLVHDARDLYRVHPTYVVDSTLRSFLEAQPRVAAAQPKQNPGDRASITYDYSLLPLPVGWTVTSKEITIYGPVFGNVVAHASLPAMRGTYEFAVPKDALYGTYVVEVELGLLGGGAVQVAHDVTAFDVLRKGVDKPVAPVYRASLAVWFEGFD